MFKSSDILSTKLDDYEILKMTFSKKSKVTYHRKIYNITFGSTKFPNGAKDDKKLFIKPQREQKDIFQNSSCFDFGKERQVKKS